MAARVGARYEDGGAWGYLLLSVEGRFPGAAVIPLTRHRRNNLPPPTFGPGW